MLPEAINTKNTNIYEADMAASSNREEILSNSTVRKIKVLNSPNTEFSDDS